MRDGLLALVNQDAHVSALQVGAAVLCHAVAIVAFVVVVCCAVL